jgi:Domain of unknown function (4846)
MPTFKVLCFLLLGCTCACVHAQNNLIRPEGATLATRIAAPKGAVRVSLPQNSFGWYLRNFKLKPNGTKVLLYDGSVKQLQSAHAAVLDIDVGKRDLQQCADAVMRLRAEFLFKQSSFDKISFHFTNGFRCEYLKWREGNRMVVEGNKTYWSRTAAYDNSYASFRKYMDLVFAYAGSLSLSKELMRVPVEQIQPGDVFIQGGSPGHAVIVMDVAVNSSSGKKYFLLAQSYLPAQDIHILVNPENTSISPWYSVDFGSNLVTPQWVFERGQLMRFR